MTENEAPSVRVAEELAAAKGIDLNDLDPLSSVVDLESVDTLFANSATPVRIECRVDGFRVEVDPDGDVSVSQPPTE